MKCCPDPTPTSDRWPIPERLDPFSLLAMTAEADRARAPALDQAVAPARGVGHAGRDASGS